jgi:HK97 gp10 family phage protein
MFRGPVMSFVYESLLKQVGKEIEKGAKKQRSKAARLVAGKIRKKISDVWVKGKHSAPGEPPGTITGNLKKGVYTFDGKNSSFAGTRSPAYHAYMLEFGTSRMKPRPFVYNTFEECASDVQKILSEPWVK